MVKSKTVLFDDDLNHQASLFKALSHPARLEILQFLARTKSCITGDISDELPLSRTTVNQHLKELRDSDLIVGTVSGVKTNYCLNSNKIDEVSGLLIKFFGNIKKMGNCC